MAQTRTEPTPATERNLWTGTEEGQRVEVEFKKKKVAVGEERWKREEKDNEVEC